MQVNRELGEALAEIRAAHPDLEVEHEMILSIPGTHTDPRSWIVQSLMRAWERREGRQHEPITGEDPSRRGTFQERPWPTTFPHRCPWTG